MKECALFLIAFAQIGLMAQNAPDGAPITFASYLMTLCLGLALFNLIGWAFKK